MNRLTHLCLMVLIAFSISCSRKPSDETITQDIQNKATANPQAQDVQVTVESKRGKVTFGGKARTEAARQELETIAKEEPGVTALMMRLRWTKTSCQAPRRRFPDTRKRLSEHRSSRLLP